MPMNFWKWTLTVITGSTAISANGSSTYQKVHINLQCTPSDVRLSRQVLKSTADPFTSNLHSVSLWTYWFCVWDSDFPMNKMQNRMEKFGAQLPLLVPTSSSQQRLFRKGTTYLAKIAVVLQDAPDKMLTFIQVRETAWLPENVHSVCLMCKHVTQFTIPQTYLNLMFSSWWTSWHHWFVKTENLLRTSSESVYQPTNALSK